MPSTVPEVPNEPGPRVSAAAKPDPVSSTSEGVDKSPIEDVPTSHARVTCGDSDNAYGPVRRRVRGQDGPHAIIMREIIPDTIEAFPHGTKRSLETASEGTIAELSASAAEPSASRPRVESSEVFSVEHLTEVDSWQSDRLDIEVLMAEYLRKRMEKDGKGLPHSRNPPHLQHMVDEGQRAEWKTMTEKPDNVCIHFGRVVVLS